MDIIPYGHQSIDEQDIAAVVEVLKGDWLTTGPAVPRFEAALCDYIGCRHAVAVNSGTSALDIAVQALDLPPGSEVITTPFTFAATANAILYNRCIPVFSDIVKETRSIDPVDIESKITAKTRAIIPVDYAGHPCDIEQIQRIARDHDLVVIEDACHALGASYRGKKIGSIADMTIFSFHPVKPITTGEGGAVVTDDPELAAVLRRLRNHGIDRDASARRHPHADYAYDMVALGRNYRMTDIQAALGLSQLPKLDLFIERRRELAMLYERCLSDAPFIETPCTKGGVVHGWHIYTVLLDAMDRDWFYARMRKEGIGVNVHYIPVYSFTYYQTRFSIDPRAFPVTEDIFRRIVTLPLFPAMQDDDVLRISEAIRCVHDAWTCEGGVRPQC